jgi:H+/Cl- antiporter ClcA
VGIDIAMVGLALQVAVIGIFIIMFGDYLIRYFRSDTTRPLVRREKLFFAALALALTLILGRCGYRCYELSQGYNDSDLITDEGLFIALEGV